MTNRIGVTVIARDGITSDWLDTAVAVLGRERGTELVESIPGAAARITTIDADGAYHCQRNEPIPAVRRRCRNPPAP